MAVLVLLASPFVILPMPSMAAFLRVIRFNAFVGIVHAFQFLNRPIGLLMLPGKLRGLIILQGRHMMFMHRLLFRDINGMR